MDVVFFVFILFVAASAALLYFGFSYTKPYEEAFLELDKIENPTEEEEDLKHRYADCASGVISPYIPFSANTIAFALSSILIFFEKIEEAFIVLIVEVLIIFPVSFIIAMIFSKRNIEKRRENDIYDPKADLNDMCCIRSCMNGLSSTGKRLRNSNKHQLDYFKHHKI